MTLTPTNSQHPSLDRPSVRTTEWAMRLHDQLDAAPLTGTAALCKVKAELRTEWARRVPYYRHEVLAALLAKSEKDNRGD